MTRVRYPKDRLATPGIRTTRPAESTNAPKANGPAPKKAANKRITTNLVALSSLAILSVYGIGYARTQTAATLAAQGDSADVPTDVSVVPPVVAPLAKPRPTTAGAATATPGPTGSRNDRATASGSEPVGQSSPAAPTNEPSLAPTVGSGALPSATTAPPSPRPTAVATPTPKPNVRTLRDGSYVGDGFSRHGDIEATVVISGGKVISASVTGCGTRYSCRLVGPLVSEVVSRQTAPIDLISGATDSSHAYRDAIIKALSQAT